MPSGEAVQLTCWPGVVLDGVHATLIALSIAHGMLLGTFVPATFQVTVCMLPPGQVTGHAQRAHRHQGHDADQEDEGVGDEHPGQQQPDQDRYPQC